MSNAGWPCPTVHVTFTALGYRKKSRRVSTGESWFSSTESYCLQPRLEQEPWILLSRGWDGGGVFLAISFVVALAESKGLKAWMTPSLGDSHESRSHAVESESSPVAFLPAGRGLSEPRGGPWWNGAKCHRTYSSIVTSLRQGQKPDTSKELVNGGTSFGPLFLRQGHQCCSHSELVQVGCHPQRSRNQEGNA